MIAYVLYTLARKLQTDRPLQDGRVATVKRLKPAFYDADTDILADTSDTSDFPNLLLCQAERHADILATILARMSAKTLVSVSASWNAGLNGQQRSLTLFNLTDILPPPSSCRERSFLPGMCVIRRAIVSHSGIRRLHHNVPV